MPVSLALQPGVVPPLDGTPRELVAALREPLPVSRAPDLVGVDSLTQLEAGRIHGMDVFQGVAELIHLRPVPDQGWPAASPPPAGSAEGIGRPAPVTVLAVLEVVVAVLVVAEGVLGRPPERIFRGIPESEPRPQCGGRGSSGGHGSGKCRGPRRWEEILGILGIPAVL